MAAYSDWAGRGGGGHWLPAYGFSQHITHQNRGFIEEDDDDESIVVAESACFTDPLLDSATSHGVTNLGNAVGGGSGNFLFLLETIVEETSDQLNGDASPRRPASSTSSAASIKNDMNSHDYDYDSDADEDVRCGSRGSEGDAEVPKKRRRKEGGPDERASLDDCSADRDEENDFDDGSISRSSSLIQFESLERQMENEVVLFKTTASDDPFGIPSTQLQDLSSSSSSSSTSSGSATSGSSSGDNEDSSSDTMTEDVSHCLPSISSPASSSSSSSSSSVLLRSQTARMRSYRSFDSLNLVAGGVAEEEEDMFRGWSACRRGGAGVGWGSGNVLTQSFRGAEGQRRSLAAFHEEGEEAEDGFNRSDFGYRTRMVSWSEGRIGTDSNGERVSEYDRDETGERGNRKELMEEWTKGGATYEGTGKSKDLRRPVHSSSSSDESDPFPARTAISKSRVGRRVGREIIASKKLNFSTSPPTSSSGKRDADEIAESLRNCTAEDDDASPNTRSWNEWCFEGKDDAMLGEEVEEGREEGKETKKESAAYGSGGEEERSLLGRRNNEGFSPGTAVGALGRNENNPPNREEERGELWVPLGCGENSAGAKQEEPSVGGRQKRRAGDEDGRRPRDDSEDATVSHSLQDKGDRDSEDNKEGGRSETIGINLRPVEKEKAEVPGSNPAECATARGAEEEKEVGSSSESGDQGSSGSFEKGSVDGRQSDGEDNRCLRNEEGFIRRAEKNTEQRGVLEREDSGFSSREKGEAININDIILAEEPLVIQKCIVPTRRSPFSPKPEVPPRTSSLNAPGSNVEGKNSIVAVVVDSPKLLRQEVPRLPADSEDSGQDLSEREGRFRGGSSAGDTSGTSAESDRTGEDSERSSGGCSDASEGGNGPSREEAERGRWSKTREEEEDNGSPARRTPLKVRQSALLTLRGGAYSSEGHLHEEASEFVRGPRQSGNVASASERIHRDEFYIGRSHSEGGINGELDSDSAFTEEEEAARLGGGEEEEEREKEEDSGREGAALVVLRGGAESARDNATTRRPKTPVDVGWRVLRILRRSPKGGGAGAVGSAARGDGGNFENGGVAVVEAKGKQQKPRGEERAGAKMKSDGKPPLPPKAGALAFLTRLSFRRRKPAPPPEKQQHPQVGATAQAHAGIDRVSSAKPPLPHAALAPPVSRESEFVGSCGAGEEVRRVPSRGGGCGAPEGRHPTSSNGGRSASLMDLGEDGGRGGGGGVGAGGGGGVLAPAKEASGCVVVGNQGSVDSRAKSMEFLLDEGNKATVLPPENELQKVGVGVLGLGGLGAPLHLSEHQLRVQRSLQKLNVPEWYLRSTAGGAHRTHPESGASSPLSLLERRHSSGRRPGGGWPGLASKTTSLSSLQTRRSPTPTRSGAPLPPSTPSSRRLLSPGVLSSGGPSPDEPGGYSSFGGSVTPRASFSRWSTSRLHQRTALSLAPSAPTSPRSSFSAPRTPYLGWRSQERLLLSDPSPHYRTPSERLAADLLASRRAAAATLAASAPTPRADSSERSGGGGGIAPPSEQPTVEVHPPQGKSPELSDVRSSITEVTSAIVHYVSERVPGEGGSTGGRSPSLGRPCSPRQLCWVESSFVGSRPIDSPQTPPDLGDGSRRGSSVVAGGASRGLSGEEAASTPNGPIRDPDEEVNVVMASGSMLEAAARRAAVRLELESFRTIPNPAATLEDVLDSLLGLPPASSSRSPSPATPASPMRHTQTTQARKPEPEVTVVVTPKSPTPPPLPQPLTIARAQSGGEGRRRNPTQAQRRARNQSRAISPPSPTRGFHMSAAMAPSSLPSEISEVSVNIPSPQEVVGATAVTTPPNAVSAEEQAASPSEEDEEEEECDERTTATSATTPTDDTATKEFPVPYYVGDTLQPKDDDTPRRRVSFEIRQLSDDSEADARRRRHGNRKRSRAAALCRRVAAAATAPTSPALPVLSRVARQGFLSRGRGCVKIFFPGPERAEAFASAAVSASLAGVRSTSDADATATALRELGEPAYAGWADLPLPTGGCGEKCYRDLVQLCRTYDTDSKLVLLVCVCVSSAETPGAGKWSRKVVSRCTCAKLGQFRLPPEPNYHPRRRPADPPPPPPRRHRAPVHQVQDFRPRSPITREMEYPETLVLRELPSAGSGSGKREIAYGNVQKHLKRRGVSLRKQFPDVHRRLRSYVEEGTVFTPAAIHPRDGLTGRPFLCIILPEGAEEPCWEGEEGGRLKSVDLGAADEEDEENAHSWRNSDEASDPSAS